MFPFDWQFVVVMALIAASAAFVARRAWRFWRPTSETPGGSCGACGSCESAKPSANPTGGAFVSLDALRDAADTRGEEPQQSGHH